VVAVVMGGSAKTTALAADFPLDPIGPSQSLCSALDFFDKYLFINFWFGSEKRNPQSLHK
jgi:hypothetical protein